jgi:uncharacterized spore protein YtfJ
MANTEPLLPSTLEGLMKEITDTIQKEANVRAVFGEPMTLDRRKIVPVSQVKVNLGGGIGSGGVRVPDHDGDKPQPFGSGGGGGLEIVVTPLGFIHETEDGVVFSAIEAPSEGLVGRVSHLLRSATGARRHG